MRELKLREEDINFIGKGIENCGNSCFMNAVNQMLFHIPELREFMIHNEGLFNSTSEKFKKRDTIHDYDLLLKLIGLFKKIKENTNQTEKIKDKTKIMGDKTLRDLYISVKNEYFDDTINEQLKDFDIKNQPMINRITQLKNEYENKTTIEKRKEDIKTEIIKIIETIKLTYLIETKREQELREELAKLMNDSPTDPRIQGIINELDRLKKDLTKIKDDIFDSLLLSYTDERNSIYTKQEDASELFLFYLSNGSNNINIIDNIIFSNYDEIIMYNSSNSRYATNYEYMINKINIPFFDFYTKTIEIKFCENDKKMSNIITYELSIQYKGKFEINLEDIIEKVHLEYCKNKADDTNNINTTKITRYIPDKYLLINIGREYSQVFKRKRIIRNIEKEPPKDLETTYDDELDIITFKYNGQDQIWDEDNEEYIDKFELNIVEVYCEMREHNTDNWFIDPDTGEVFLASNIDQIKPKLYVTKRLVNYSPISNYDTTKNEMIINYNDGTNKIKYNLIGTICKSGGVEEGHYWYHHKINNIWYQYNDSSLTPNSPPNTENMLIVLFRREGDDYTIPIYDNVSDLKLHFLQQIKKNVMTYDNELSDDLSKTDKLKEDIKRLLYYSNKHGSNTTQIDEELLKINKEFKTKINSILKP